MSFDMPRDFVQDVFMLVIKVGDQVAGYPKTADVIGSYTARIFIVSRNRDSVVN
jgi:hypothetical protein